MSSHPRPPSTFTGEVQLAAERQGNLMGFASGLWGDSSGHWSAGGYFGDIGNLVLRRNGEQIGDSFYTFGVFEVPAEDAEYELQLNTRRSVSRPRRGSAPPR